jgi:hypothetical protein
MPGSQRTMLSAATGAPARGEHVRAPQRTLPVERGPPAEMITVDMTRLA